MMMMMMVVVVVVYDSGSDLLHLVRENLVLLDEFLDPVEESVVLLLLAVLVAVRCRGLREERRNNRKEAG